MHNFQEALDMGRWGEIVMIGMFLVDRWSVVATADYSGPPGQSFAPSLHQLENKTVLADFDLSKLGLRMWCDAKLKSRFFKWRKTNRIQTGCETRSYWQYVQLEQRTGSQVVLGMIDMTTGHIYCNTLEALGEPRYSPESSSYSIANWDRDNFYRTWSIDPKQLRKLIFFDDSKVIRKPPAVLPPLAKFLRMVDFLQPAQRELPLLYFDMIGRSAQLRRRA
jgi:hypothetical protein